MKNEWDENFGLPEDDDEQEGSGAVGWVLECAVVVAFIFILRGCQ